MFLIAERNTRTFILVVTFINSSFAFIQLALFLLVLSGTFERL